MSAAAGGLLEVGASTGHADRMAATPEPAVVLRYPKTLCDLFRWCQTVHLYMTQVRMQDEKKPLDIWAIVEQMGHRSFAGRVTEETIGGTVMVRIDVPATEHWPEGYTKYLGGASVFALHPCSEEIARSAAAQIHAQWGFQPMPVHVPELSAATETIRQARALRAGQDDDLPPY